ncbi:MAG: methyltransferase [Pirellulaceae bacterium]|nr:methyltransferase [Pirellulaceae bacterium]
MDDRSTNELARYLCVDRFLQNLVGATSLKTAFDLRVIDRLVGSDGVDHSALYESFEFDRQGFDMLLNLLTVNQVIESSGERIRLTEPFAHALQYRDLLQAKLDFAILVTPDLADLFTSLIANPAQFMEQSRVFRLFDYQRCLKLTPENYAATKRWMHFTSTLTRYESAFAMCLYDFSQHQRMLDVGGNSGEFLLQVCKQHAQLQGTVFDLPVVCVVGQEHLLQQPEADRITFMKGSAVDDALPRGFDSIVFKSMLHDWPESMTYRILSKAAQVLEPGGTLLIFERGPIHASELHRFPQVPMLLFFRAFRAPEIYQTQLSEMGMVDITVEWIDLEMPFFLLTAKKM